MNHIIERRTPFLIDEGELILQILAIVQVEKFRSALGIVARQRMGRNIVDLLVADPDNAAIVERVEIVLAGSKHAASP